LLLVLILTSGAWLPLVHPGFLSTRTGGDSPFLLIRLDQLVRNVRAGVIPARWMPDAAYGLGYPFFNYYAALPYYLAAGLVLWGWGPIAALKITQAIGFLASGAAMYALARHAFRRRASALVASVAYVYAPFHLVNVYVRGDSLSEFYAFVWYPLLGWAILRLWDRASVSNVLLLGVVHAGLVLTHNVSALIATAIAAVYAVLLLLTDGRGEGLTCRLGARPGQARFLLATLFGGLLGLGLSSWFWLPALLERELVQLQEMTTGYFHFARHFRGMDLVQQKWFFDYTIGRDRTPFSMGLVQTLLAGLGSLALMAGWIRRRRTHPQAVVALALLLLITFCITPLSRGLWERVPLLPLAQFPWRLLSVQTVFTSLLIGVLVERLPHPHLPGGTRRTVAVVHLLLPAATILLLIGSALGDLRPEWMSIGEGDITAERLRLYEYFTANIGTTVRWEYLPRTVETRPFTSAVFLNQGGKPPPMVIAGEVNQAHALDMGPTWEVWDITVASSLARVAFHTHYFPGWRATLDGRAHPLSPVEGWGTIGLTLPEGHHRVSLRLGRTSPRWTGEFISLLALVAALALLGLTVRPQDKPPLLKRWWCRAETLHSPYVMALAACILLLGAVGVGLHTYRQRARLTPAAPSPDLSMDFVRHPYLHHNPDGIRYGDEARLLHYTFSADEIQAGEALTVTLAWDTASQLPLSAKVRLLSASKPVFDKSGLEVWSRAPLEAGRTVHRLETPSSAVSGPYLLMVQLRHPRGMITPLTSEGKELGSIYLQPVWVRAVTHDVLAQEPLGRFGERVVLIEAQTERRTADRLYVHLSWRALRPVPANYNLSLRLKDPSGLPISVRDMQPYHGFYPTTLWPVGVAVRDILSLPVPEDTPSEGGYTLAVILYSVSTLSPVGQVEVDVQLSE
jgi:hypothetical protein